MAPGDRIPEWQDEELDISTYVMDMESMEEMENLLAYDVTNEQLVANQEENSTKMAVSENRDTEMILENKAEEQREEASGDDSPVERKPRVVWTKEMHRKFLDAMEILGPDNSFPKKIVELMNEPGLTRENVASHLQKYRMYLRKKQEEAANSNTGTNLLFPLSNSALSVNFLQRYYQHVNPEPYSFRYQQGSSSGIISTPYLQMSPPTGLTGLSILNPTNLEQQSGLMQMQQYASKHPMHSNFRMYGDETRSMFLSSNEDHRSPFSNNSVTTTLNSQNLNSFIGLRFTDAGNLEFGQTSKSEIEKTSTLSSVGTTSVAETLDQSHPVTPATYAPMPPNIEVKNDQFPSIFSDWTSEEDQEILALLTAPLEAENVTLEENMPGRAFMPLNAQEQYFPSGASGNNISVQEFPSFDSMNEAAECSFSPDKFWKEVYGNADINHFH